MHETPNSEITPYLCVHDGAAAIEFYVRVFGAAESFRVLGDDGRIGHADLSIGSAQLMLSDEYPDHGAVSPRTVGGSPVTLHLDVDHCDASYGAAVAAGATGEREPADQTHGSRTATIVDPFGHRWMLSQTLEALDLATYAERETGGFSVEAAVGSGSTDARTEPDAMVWPSLNYVDAPAAIRLLVDLFGFEERLVVTDDDPSVVRHSQLRWPEGGGVMLGSAGRSHDEFSQRPTGTGAVYVVTPRVDELWRRCLDAELAVVSPLKDEDYGNHGFSVRDPEGNIWSFGTYSGE